MTGVARSYARALYEAAIAAKATPETIDQIDAQLNAIASAIEASREAKVALFGPVTTAKEKAAVMAELARKVGAAELLTRLLDIMARKRRLPIIGEIRDAFRSVRLHAEGGVQGTLVAADPVGDADIDGLAKAFSRKLGKKVAFRVSTDPTLLAGMKVTVNGVTYDGTLRSQLERLRDRLIAGYSA